MRKVFSLLRRWEKWMVLVLGTAAIVGLYWNWHIFYVAHTTPVAANGGIVIEGMVGQPRFINPILATTPTDQTIVHAVFSGLYRYNSNGELEPDLATTLPEASNDGKQYTVRIQPGRTWHDGKAITADDVLFTISHIQNESVQSPLRGLWLSTSVQKLDALTVVFTTKDVSAPFVHNLTVPLLPEHAWTDVKPEDMAAHPLNLKPLGSGPFAVRQIEKSQEGTVRRLILQSYANHSRRPKLDGITLVFYNSADSLRQGYLNREINTIGSTTNDGVSTTDENAQLQQAVLPQYQALFLNTSNPTLSDPQVRKALRLATNSNTITEAAWGNRARAITEAPLGLVKYESTPAPTSPEEAKKILDAAGWAYNNSDIRSKGAVSLKLVLATTDTPNFRVAAQLVAQSWQAIGVGVEIKALPATDLIAQHVRPRQYDVLLFSQRTGADLDPFAFWHSSQTKDPGLNVSNFSSGEADKLITDARTTKNPEERDALYKKLSGLLTSQVPAIYLNQSLYTYILDKDITAPTIHALPDPAWRLSHAPDWYMRTTRTWR